MSGVQIINDDENNYYEDNLENNLSYFRTMCQKSFADRILVIISLMFLISIIIPIFIVLFILVLYYFYLLICNYGNYVNLLIVTIILFYFLK